MKLIILNALLLVAVVGHLALWATIFNQIHATAWPRPSRKFSEKIIYLIVFALLFLLAWNCWIGLSPAWLANGLKCYGWACMLIAAGFTIRWLVRLCHRRPVPVRNFKSRLIDVAAEAEGSLLHGWQAGLLGKIPFNQAQQLCVQQFDLLVPDLPAGLEGLKIAHLSDLHFTGKLDIAFFERVVEQTNQLDADLICLTGDVIDDIKCMSWLAPILGKIDITKPKLFVLGNHDRRIEDEKRLRQQIESQGWAGLGYDLVRLEFNGVPVVCCGNELPWYEGANSISNIDVPEGGFSILLSHSPDQFSWARNHQFNLVLAGHTHGGQIRFPLIGPVIAPSCYGVKFASGTFQLGQTVMHVSRGISGDDLIRINCPPELSLIVLQRAE